MSTLLLRIEKDIDTRGVPPQVFAKIYAVEKGTAQRALDRPPIEELVPISPRTEHVKAIQVQPGGYYVESILPSGEVLAGHVLVASNQTQELVLRGEQSPHEWLSWQHLVGNVQSAPEIETIEPRRRMDTRGRGAQLKPIPGGRSRGSIAGVKMSGPGLFNPKLYLLDEPVKELETQPWKHLANLATANSAKLLLDLNRAKPGRIPASREDNEHALFNVRVRLRKSPRTGARSRSNRHPPRYFAAVPRSDSLELISLPVPWKVRDGEADVEVVVSEASDSDKFCAAAMVRDEELGILLGYLSSGSLPAARRIAETAKALLYDKMTNPYAAAAGAYALVGTALKADQEWHQWVAKLMKRFPHVPDGAIQWGQLKLRLRRSPEDIQEATKAFKLAYSRGLPFYSLGMRWLLDGLESISAEDAEANAMLKYVRQLAWRINYQQPFTILRLGGPERV
jgi:hypothetical protein